jgi:MSHA pilin protein MshA
MLFPHSKAQTGFTLIELVSVVTIIGIMAAVAVPKFVDMQKEARVAAVLAAAGNIQSASDTVHAACLAIEGCAAPSAGAVTTVAGVTGAFWYGGYATALSRLPAAVGITDFVMVSGFTFTVVGGDLGYFSRDDAPDPTNCRVEYHLNNISAAVFITSQTTGC